MQGSNGVFHSRLYPPTQTVRPSNFLPIISCLDQVLVSVIESRRMGGESWGRKKAREGADQQTASAHCLTHFKSCDFHTHFENAPVFKWKYGTKPPNKFLLNYQTRAESRLRPTKSFFKFLFISTFVYECVILGGDTHNMHVEANPVLGFWGSNSGYQNCSSPFICWAISLAPDPGYLHSICMLCGIILCPQIGLQCKFCHSVPQCKQGRIQNFQEEQTGMQLSREILVTSQAGA